MRYPPYINQNNATYSDLSARRECGQVHQKARRFLYKNRLAFVYTQNLQMCGYGFGNVDKVVGYSFRIGRKRQILRPDVRGALARAKPL